MAGWKVDVSPNRLKASAVPLTKLQSHVLRLLAAEREADAKALTDARFKFSWKIMWPANVRPRLKGLTKG